MTSKERQRVVVHRADDGTETESMRTVAGEVLEQGADEAQPVLGVHCEAVVNSAYPVADFGADKLRETAGNTTESP